MYFFQKWEILSIVSCAIQQMLVGYLFCVYIYIQYCCCSVTQSCLTLCKPMGCSTLGFPVLHHLLEFDQTHVHRIHDAIQLFYPLLSPSPPAFNLSQHQGLSNNSALRIRWPKY